MWKILSYWLPMNRIIKNNRNSVAGLETAYI